jgi:hypothetical protein
VKNLPLTFPALPGSLFATPESDLVAALSRQPPNPFHVERVLACIESGVNWGRAFTLAEHWEVEPVFFANLMRLAPDIPSEILDRAKTNELRARSRATAATLWSIDVLDKLEAAGIPCILLKGPALGVVAYDDLSFRTFADADLLVPESDLTRAGDHLQNLGFEPVFRGADQGMLIRNGHALEFAGNGRKVELHWTLLSHHLALDMPSHELWKSSISVSIAGRNVRTLDRSTLFLFLCAHGAKHEWERFRWVCDVAQLGDRLTDLEIARVEALALQHNARRIVLLGIEMARSIAYADVERLGAHRFGEAGRLTSLVKRAVNHYESLAEHPPSPGPGDFESRFAALRYWVGARERITDRILVLTRAFLAPINAHRRNFPLTILRRSARLVSLAFRRPSV